MNAAAWVFLAAFAVTNLLLVIAIGANTDLAAENRRLRARIRHQLQPGTTPIFDQTLADTNAAGSRGGAA